MTTKSNSRVGVSRRQVLRTAAVVSGASLLGVTATGSAAAAKGEPDFSPRIWGDGVEWGTKVTGILKNPNENSLDKFFVITAGAAEDLHEATLPVSEAAPGNPDYNGGRWWTHTVEWTQDGVDSHGPTPPLLTRYGPADDPESILFHENLGHLTVTEGSPAGGPPPYFRCPMLPVKDD